MASAVDLCNRALQRLGEASITSLTDDSNRARECNRVYEYARDAELRKHVWSFARARAQLAASSTAPPFGYNNAFPLPADFLRLHPLNDVTDWQIEDGQILTDDDAPLNIVYVKRETDVNNFDPLFFEALSAKIALELAERIRQPTSTQMEVYILQYQEEIKHAKRVNAIERVALEPPADTWVTVRNHGRSGD